MATVTITAITEFDASIDLTCSFSVTVDAAITWVEIVNLGRERLAGLTQAQMRDEVLFPICQKIINGRVGIRRAQLGATGILNVAQTVPGTP
mgnify:CR=1 FL=1